MEEGDVLVGPGAVFLSGFCQFNYEIFRLVQNPVCKQLQYGVRFLRNFAFKSPVFGNACMRENIYITNTNFLRKTPQNAWDHICLEIWFLSKKLLLQKDWYAYLIGISKIINKLCHYGHFLKHDEYSDSSLSMLNIEQGSMNSKLPNKMTKILPI